MISVYPTQNEYKSSDRAESYKIWNIRHSKLIKCILFKNNSELCELKMQSRIMIIGDQKSIDRNKNVTLFAIARKISYFVCLHEGLELVYFRIFHFSVSRLGKNTKTDLLMCLNLTYPRIAKVYLFILMFFSHQDHSFVGWHQGRSDGERDLQTM